MKQVLSLDTSTHTIRDIALQFRKAGLTPDEFRENPGYYLNRLKQYEIPLSDFDEVAFCVFCFMKYIQF